MRLTSVVTQWLKDKEWDDVPDVDEENQSSSTAFNYSIDDFSVFVAIDAYEKSGLAKLYMYYREPSTPEKRADEVQRFCNAVTLRLPVGALLFLREKRAILYYAGMDFENAAFEPAHLQNLFTLGENALKSFLPAYMAVCFGGKTAEEALEMED